MKGAASARASPFFPASPSLPAPGAPLPDKRRTPRPSCRARPVLGTRHFRDSAHEKEQSIAFLPQRSERRWKTAKHGRSGRSPLRTQTDVPYRRAKPGVFPAGQAFPRHYAQIRPAHGQQVVLKKIRLRPLRLRRVLVLCGVTSRSVLPSARSLLPFAGGGTLTPLSAKRTERSRERSVPFPPLRSGQSFERLSCKSSAPICLPRPKAHASVYTASTNAETLTQQPLFQAASHKQSHAAEMSLRTFRRRIRAPDRRKFPHERRGGLGFVPVAT